MTEDMKKRLLALSKDPSIHDPEALKLLLDGMTEKARDLLHAVSQRDAVIFTCRRLAAAHASECGVTAMIASVLHSVELEPVINAIHTFGVETAQTADGQYVARSVSIPGDETIIEVGPMPNREAARQAAFDQTAQKLGIDTSKATPIEWSTDAAMSAAMGGQKPGVVH